MSVTGVEDLNSTLATATVDVLLNVAEHLQRHGDLKSYDFSSFRTYDETVAYRFFASFSRLPLAYSLGYLSWKGFEKNTVLSLFPDLINDNRKLRYEEEWNAPLRYPKRIEKFLQKAIELGMPIVIDRELDSVELMEAIIGLALRSVDPAERLERRTALELAAMHGACFTGAESVARHLLSVSNADLRNGLYKEMFPLYTLASKGHVNLMRILFDPVEGEAPEFDVDCLYELYEDRTPLLWAAANNETKAALWLLGHGADTDQCKDRLLSYAVSKENTVLAEVALVRGAKVNREFDSDDKDRRTYLHEAVIAKNAELARLLMAHGASIDESDFWCLRPLHYTVCFNDLELFDLLLSFGADPITGDEHELTVLHRAVGADRLDIVKRLYAIDAVRSRITVLMYAAFHWRLEVMEWLLEYGGWAEFINAKDAEGRTTLKYFKRSDYDSLELLRWISYMPEEVCDAADAGEISRYGEEDCLYEEVEELLKRYGAEE
ncbi:hypothetical protein HDU96_001619 [Phlyctochytrium bullatum]|nr:hypothetical protein HDU96_001619 [Phlyctochytrium bullatum]